MDLLAIALWAGAGGGVMAVVVAIVTPGWRRRALLVAAALFLPIGVLGLMTVGAVFLTAALGCGIAGVVSPGEGSRGSTSSRA